MKIYFANINDFDEAFFENALNFIPAEKKEDICRFKNERAKKESLLGWYLFSVGMKETGSQNGKLCFFEKGKPYLENSSSYFNISHSDGLVCCAFAKSAIGIDIEKPKPFSPLVVKRVLCENEIKVLEESPKKEETFIRFWTFKESILKQSGEGITAGLKKFDFSSFIDEREFVYKNLNFITGEIEGFLFSVCTLKKEPEIVLRAPADIGRHRLQEVRVLD